MVLTEPRAALGTGEEIPALRVCEAICSTDCHAPLAMTDWSERRDPCGNAKKNIKGIAAAFRIYPFKS
ncbi:MAG: hypothetical protein CVU08_12555 [Bacteroidetes bacterium HGW-Bacteroidetes-3]|nr:MAG: hypothetical protein CVU08_12555 [Bacteroidetes bacterium HGW-Bacteroidetes-3]